MNTRRMDALAEWLIDNAMTIRSSSDLLEGVCQRLSADGMPIIRGNISLAVIDPMFRARLSTWTPGNGSARTLSRTSGRSANSRTAL